MFGLFSKKKPERELSVAKKQEAKKVIAEVVRASYDTIARTRENDRHWQFIDYLSPDAALRAEVRKEIRAQARYEVLQNNSIGRGIVDTVISDTIGTGPRLQMELVNEKYNRAIEEQFGYWAQAVGLRDILSQFLRSKIVDGAGLGRSVNDMTIDDPVSFGMQLIEVDQLDTAEWRGDDPNYIDGIHLNTLGRPVAYDILRYHPGNQYPNISDPYEYKTYPAEQVLHYFSADRPGQHHGVSELVTALPLFAFLRRFTLATISAAETAANVAQVIKTDAPVPDDLENEWAESTFGAWMDTIPIDRNQATVLPNQWDLKQFAAEHPTTTYRMFKQEIINEIARCIAMPKNIAAADSSDYNYASGRLDHLGYKRKTEIRQSDIGAKLCDYMFANWLIEASLLGIIPAVPARQVIEYTREYGYRGIASRFQHSWYWDGFEDADATKNANAQRTRLQSGTTHRAAEYAKVGKDVEVEDEKAARSFGMTIDEYRKAVAISLFTNGNAFGPEGQTNVEEEAEDDSGDGESAADGGDVSSEREPSRV